MSSSTLSQFTSIRHKIGATLTVEILNKGLFTWSVGPRSSGVGFFCFHALGDTKQKKPTPLDRGPPLHVNRVLLYASNFFGVDRPP